MQFRMLGNTKLRVSVIGFGAATLGNVYGDVSVREGEAAVHCAIERGINFFDVSPYYGITLAEERLGAALEGRRDKVVLATKCGRYGADRFDFSAARIRKSIDESLTRLRTDHVDLLLAHDVEFTHVEQILNETLPEMRAIQRAGKATAIGITGYSLRNLRQIAEAAEVDAVLSYCRCNLMVDDMEGVLGAVAKQKGVGLINASPLHMGLLTEQGPPSWHPAPAEVKRAAGAVVDLCRSRGVNVAEVGLRWCLDQSFVASTLVGMTSVAQVEENLRLLEVMSDPALIAEIGERLGPLKNVTWPSGLEENYG